MTRYLIAATVAGLLSLAAAAEEPQTALVFDDAWIRALPASQPNTAAYLTLSNQGRNAVAIIGANSEIASKVEIHTTREVDGYLRMEQLDGLALAAGETLSLAPGGIHLMLLGLAYAPRPGDEIRICLELASGDEACTEAAVRKLAPGQQHHNHH